MPAKATRPQKQLSEQERSHFLASEGFSERASPHAKPNRAPPAVAFEWVVPLRPDDIQQWATRFGETLTERDCSYSTERLNEAVSEFLRDAPGTVGRSADERRYAWFTDLVETSRHLQALLRPEGDAALLLSGLGGSMLWMSTTGAVELSVQEWRSEIADTIAFLDKVSANAAHGRNSVERSLFQVRTELDGWPTVLDNRRMGRPKDLSFRTLADEFLVFWKFLTGEEPTVIVDPLQPSARRSKAAHFVAEMLETVARRLGPHDAWAAPLLKGTAQRLVVHIGRRKRPPVNRKRQTTE